MCWEELRPGRTRTQHQCSAPTCASAAVNALSSWRSRFGLVTSPRPFSIGAASATTSGRTTDLPCLSSLINAFSKLYTAAHSKAAFVCSLPASLFVFDLIHSQLAQSFIQLSAFKFKKTLAELPFPRTTRGPASLQAIFFGPLRGDS